MSVDSSSSHRRGRPRRHGRPRWRRAKEAAMSGDVYERLAAALDRLGQRLPAHGVERRAAHPASRLHARRGGGGSGADRAARRGRRSRAAGRARARARHGDARESRGARRDLDGSSRRRFGLPPGAVRRRLLRGAHARGARRRVRAPRRGVLLRRWRRGDHERPARHPSRRPRPRSDRDGVGAALRRRARHPREGEFVPCRDVRLPPAAGRARHEALRLPPRVVPLVLLRGEPARARPRSRTRRPSRCSTRRSASGSCTR